MSSEQINDEDVEDDGNGKRNIKCGDMERRMMKRRVI
jgi:hypothetical protein